MISSVKYTLVFIIAFLALSCLPDAERDNPLDNNNPGTYLRLDGIIYTYYPPYHVIKNAIIYMQPGSHVVMSDHNGAYCFEKVLAGNYTLTCQADSFEVDTVQVEISANTSHNFNLNGLPEISNISLTTHHLLRWYPPEDIYYLELSATVDDKDGTGDINFVHYQIPSENFCDTLQQGATAGEFNKQLLEGDMPAQSIQSLTGKEFIFYVCDKPGATVSSANHFLTRIIEKTPVLVSPVYMQHVQSPPINLKWEEVSLPYNFTYKIELFIKNEINQFIKFDEIEKISADSTSFSYEPSLDAGDYYWILSIIDEFNNSSCSKEGGFVVD